MSPRRRTDEHRPTTVPYSRDVSEQADNVIPFPTAPEERAPEPEPRLRDVLGDVLRDERQSQDRTLAEVADEAAVSLPYLSEIERGRKEVSSDVLDAIVRSLELDLAEVLERAADRLRSSEAPGMPRMSLLAA